MKFDKQYYIRIYRLSLICIALVLIGDVIVPWVLVFVKDGVKNLIEGVPLATIAGFTLYLLLVTTPVNLIFSTAAYWSSGRLTGLESIEENPRQQIAKRLVWVNGVISILLLIAGILFMIMLQNMDLGGIR